MRIKRCICSHTHAYKHTHTHTNTHAHTHTINNEIEKNILYFIIFPCLAVPVSFTRECAPTKCTLLCSFFYILNGQSIGSHFLLHDIHPSLPWASRQSNAFSFNIVFTSANNMAWNLFAASRIPRLPRMNELRLRRHVHPVCHVSYRLLSYQLQEKFSLSI